MASKIEWQRISRTTVLAESVQFVLALVFLALGWVKFPLVYALAGIEVLLVVVMSGFLYRLRSVGTIIVDTLKSVVLWLFCGAFILGAYYSATGFRHGLGINARGFATLAALLGVRLGWHFFEAYASRDPRLYWTREVAVRGAVLALSFFFGAFACFIPGLLIANGLVQFLPTTAVDLSLGFSLLAVQALLSCVVATMSPEELAAISRQPYHTP